MNRKGFIGDSATVIAVLFLIALTVFVGFKIFSQYNTTYQAGDASNTSKGLLSDSFNRYAGLWDGIFAMVFGLFAIALVLSVASIGSRPEFFFIVLIIGVFIIGVSAAISNAYFDVANNENLPGVADQFTYIPLIMNNLAEITLFLVALLIIGLYVKIRGLV